jgi:molecular chaperone DnaK
MVESKPEEIIIGIDLGTTNSCVAVYANGICKIIPNALTNKNLTPSVVAYCQKSTIVGDKAFNQIHKNQANTIINVKRLIG